MLCSIGCNKIGDTGASALAAILNKTMIPKLECAAAPECLLLCQRPLKRAHTTALSPFPFLLVAHRLGHNRISDQAMQAIKDAADSRVTIVF